MISHAELLGIDLDKLEAERFSHYFYKPLHTRKYDVKVISEAPKETDWLPIAQAANSIYRSVQSLRRWVADGKIRSTKLKGRLYVHREDIARHAGNSKPEV